MTRFSVNGTNYCIDCSKDTLDILVRQMNILNFSFDARKVDLNVNNDRVCAVLDDKGLPLFYLARNFEEISPLNEFRRLGHFLLENYIKSIDEEEFDNSGRMVKCASFNVVKYKVNSIVVEEFGNEGVLVAITKPELTGEIHQGLVNYFKNEVLPSINSKNPSVKPLADFEYFFDGAKRYLNEGMKEFVSSHLRVLINVLLNTRKEVKTREYSRAEFVTKNEKCDSIFTINVEHELFNSKKRYASKRLNELSSDGVHGSNLILEFTGIPVKEKIQDLQH